MTDYRKAMCLLRMAEMCRIDYPDRWKVYMDEADKLLLDRDSIEETSAWKKDLDIFDWDCVVENWQYKSPTELKQYESFAAFTVEELGRFLTDLRNRMPNVHKRRTARGVQYFLPPLMCEERSNDGTRKEP